MRKIELNPELTAAHIQEKTELACQEVAFAHELYARFRKLQHVPILFPHGQRKLRENTFYNFDFSVDFQKEPPQRPAHPIGSLLIFSPFEPDNKAYGGFDFGRGQNEAPSYPYITLMQPRELEQIFRPNLEHKLRIVIYDCIEAAMVLS